MPIESRQTVHQDKDVTANRSTHSTFAMRRSSSRRAALELLVGEHER